MKKIYIFLILLLSIPVIAGLLHPGFFLTDDGDSMVIRFSAFYEAFRHGQFPVRFLPRLNQEFGYPVADFLYPLFLYIGVPIKIIGFNFVNTIKIIIGSSIIISAIFTFFWLQRIFNSRSAFAGAIVYMFFPYHLWDVYKRGSVGEVLSLAIVPFILLQIEKRNLALSGIGIGLLILAHNVLALLFLPLILIYLLLSKNFTLKKIIVLLLIGLCISAFFWIPALTDKKYTIFDNTIVSEFSKYFIFSQDYGLIGLISILSLLTGSVALWKRKAVIGVFFWITAVVSILLSLPVSSFLWQVLPGTYFIQFPFRLLSITTLSISYLTAFTIFSLPKRFIWFALLFIIIISFVSAIGYLTPIQYRNVADTFYSTNVETTTVKDEYMPVWVKTSPKNIPGEKVFLADGTGVINSVNSNGNRIMFNAIVNKPSIVQVNTVFFPGWVASVDNKQTEIKYDNTYGVIQVPLNVGSHFVSVKFTETPIRLLSDIISLLTIFGLLAFLFFSKKHDEIT